MSDELPPHILAARQFLSPEKARTFEESYLRMRLKSRTWDAGVLRDDLKALTDTPSIKNPPGISRRIRKVEAAERNTMGRKNLRRSTVRSIN